jgi:hypothetical protein
LRQSRHAAVRIDLRKPKEKSRPASGNLRRVRIWYAQLRAAKVSNPIFEEKSGNSPDISKGISQSGMYKFESSRPNATSISDSGCGSFDVLIF